MIPYCKINCKKQKKTILHTCSFMNFFDAIHSTFLNLFLGCFLVCWIPFFTCNIFSAISIKFELPDWRPSINVFLITTWLGYINSILNPIIYTIFNMEFRKAFKKIFGFDDNNGEKPTPSSAGIGGVPTNARV